MNKLHSKTAVKSSNSLVFLPNFLALVLLEANGDKTVISFIDEKNGPKNEDGVRFANDTRTIPNRGKGMVPTQLLEAALSPQGQKFKNPWEKVEDRLKANLSANVFKPQVFDDGATIVLEGHYIQSVIVEKNGEIHISVYFFDRIVKGVNGIETIWRENPAYEESFILGNNIDPEAPSHESIEAFVKCYKYGSYGYTEFVRRRVLPLLVNDKQIVAAIKHAVRISKYLGEMQEQIEAEDNKLIEIEHEAEMRALKLEQNRRDLGLHDEPTSTKTAPKTQLEKFKDKYAIKPVVTPVVEAVVTPVVEAVVTPVVEAVVAPVDKGSDFDIDAKPAPKKKAPKKAKEKEVVIERATDLEVKDGDQAVLAVEIVGTEA